ncbi:uncharacterized protein Dvar_53170 [Desulfosarcina variabilis str. Montpellier]|uniref:hypothetical protein n=1 Tax=Desulfosarcina variabilis TaxID=2300 RepID=UPI003AFABD2A
MEGIDTLVAFLRDIGCPTRLSELGIDNGLFSQYADDAVLVLHDEDGNLLGRPAMSKADIVDVLKSALRTVMKNGKLRCTGGQKHSH